MASCASCGSTILFGGATSGSYRFCNAACLSRNGLVQLAQQVPGDLVAREAERMHGGPCPRCEGPGPVDVYHSHIVWSALILTSWKSERHVCCRGCARKQQLLAFAVCGVAGWWGFPWGLIVTPVQLIRNAAALAGGTPLEPSPAMHEAVRMAIAAQAAQQSGAPRRAAG